MQHTSAIFLLFLVITLVAPHRIRRHRRFYGSDDSSEGEIVPNPHPIKTPPCDMLCDAQWKSDFQLAFGKLYDTSYYDIPLDSVVLGTKQSLNSFCSITQQKFECYTRECEIEKIPWTAERHICEDKIAGFRENHGCLAKTANIVRRDCSDVCNQIPAKLSTQEIIFLRSMRLSIAENDEFVEQNRNCHFAACHQVCHEQTIVHLCDEGEREKALSVVREYYDAFLLNDWREMEHHERLFSSFCRRVTSGMDENAFVLNMTRYNNQQLDRIKGEVKLMLQTP